MKTLTHVIPSALLTGYLLLSPSILMADDTEIYFAKADSQKVFYQGRDVDAAITRFDIVVCHRWCFSACRPHCRWEPASCLW